MTRADMVGALPGFIAPALVYLGIITANRMQRGTQRETQDVTNLRDDVKTLKAEMTQVREENRLLQDYVHSLRDHISKGQPPPPPPWPEGLHT